MNHKASEIKGHEAQQPADQPEERTAVQVNPENTGDKRYEEPLENDGAYADDSDED